ncbi:hypothetical protein [Streptomyces sp. NPDC048623]|uniref:hypothetical protein n=1 Tax=Streptomyces sp. NPDC048623 TaxID=3155761 RepID=UPI00343A3374
MTTHRYVLRRRSRLPGGVLLAAAVLTAVAYPLGSRAAESSRLLVLLTVFAHLWPFLLATAVLLAPAVWLLTRQVAVRVPVLVLCAGAALAAVPLARTGASWDEIGLVPAPAGVDRRVVVESGPNAIDPPWRVTVVAGSGLAAHSWPATTFRGAPEDYAHAEITWRGPDELRIVRNGSEVTTVLLDPHTGEPVRERTVR